MPKKPQSFADIVGHTSLIEYLTNHLTNGTLPQFIIFEGDEGLGKSSIAKILALLLTGNDPDVCRQVILENRSTEGILLYNMSVDGGKSTAKEVEANLNPGLSGLDRRVIILDEAHGLSEAAQEVFLVKTEYLPKGVYLFMCTTNSANLKPSLRSRALTLHLHHLKHGEMVKLLTQCVRDNNLKLQSETSTISMIASWAEGKPRVALNLLEGFGPGTSVSLSTIKEFIDYLEIEDIVPLLACLSGSMTQGLSYISEMKLNASLVPMLVEILKVKDGKPSFKLSLTDTHRVRAGLAGVPIEILIRFVTAVASLPSLTRPGVISAFLRCHVDSQSLTTPPAPAEVLKAEMQQKLEAPRSTITEHERPAAPSLGDLLQRGVVCD